MHPAAANTRAPVSDPTYERPAVRVRRPAHPTSGSSRSLALMPNSRPSSNLPDIDGDVAITMEIKQLPNRGAARRVGRLDISLNFRRPLAAFRDSLLAAAQCAFWPS
jgi:hypothetical protein